MNDILTAIYFLICFGCFCGTIYYLWKGVVADKEIEALDMEIIRIERRNEVLYRIFKIYKEAREKMK